MADFENQVENASEEVKEEAVETESVEEAGEATEEKK